MARLRRRTKAGRRAGTDQAHLPPQHVEELGQLVQMGGAEQPPQASHPLVVDRRPHRPAALGVHLHGAELPHAEGPAAKADPLLAVEQRAAVLEAVDEPDQRRDEHRQQAADQAGEQVDGRLDGTVDGPASQGRSKRNQVSSRSSSMTRRSFRS